MICVYWWSCVAEYLAELGHDLPQKAVQYGELPAQVDVPLKAPRITDTVQVGDLIKELLHGAPLHFQELIHETHVLLFVAKPVDNRRKLEMKSRIISGQFDFLKSNCENGTNKLFCTDF